jgi:hypothetical protein
MECHHRNLNKVLRYAHIKVFIMLYYSILLHWVQIRFPGAVLEVKLLVVLLDCWCAMSSLHINVNNSFKMLK